ncbi:MAG: hypothetical protein R3C03_08785 [Pirellulaceae bacterium]
MNQSHQLNAESLEAFWPMRAVGASRRPNLPQLTLSELASLSLNQNETLNQWSLCLNTGKSLRAKNRKRRWDCDRRPEISTFLSNSPRTRASTFAAVCYSFLKMPPLHPWAAVGNFGGTTFTLTPEDDQDLLLATLLYRFVTDDQTLNTRHKLLEPRIRARILIKNPRLPARMICVTKLLTISSTWRLKNLSDN